MMSLVVDDDDSALVSKLAANSADNLVLGLRERSGLFRTQKLLGKSRRFTPLARQKRVVVSDNDLGSLQLFHEFRRQEVALAVVTLGVVREENAEAVADGDAGTNDEKRVAEPRVLRV